MYRQITFCELREKDVINVVDGKSLGCIVDLAMDYCTGLTVGLILPSENHGFFNFFKCEQIFVPWQNICKIGEDVILVELFDECGGVGACSTQTLSKKDKKEEKQKSKYNYNYTENLDPYEPYPNYEPYPGYEEPKPYEHSPYENKLNKNNVVVNNLKSYRT